MKVCAMCETKKPLEDFYIISKKNPEKGHHSWCKECSKSASRKHYKENRRPKKCVSKVFANWDRRCSICGYWLITIRCDVHLQIVDKFCPVCEWKDKYQWNGCKEK